MGMTAFSSSFLLPAMPELVLTISAMAMLVLGAFKGKSFVRNQIRIAIAVVLFAIVINLATPDGTSALFAGMFENDALTNYSKMLILFGALLVLLLSIGFYREYEELGVCEYPVLILLSVAGMMLMVSTMNLLSLYLGLEMQSLALYILASIHRDNVKSSEAGMKYFILGSLASGIFLFGCSFIYGFSGTTSFHVLQDMYQNAGTLPIGVLVGMVFVLVALCFKVSAVPFHMWTPDVYEGSPMPVTAFFTIAPKVAATVILVRFVMVPFEGVVVQWQQVIEFAAAASMIVGALGALRQTNIKRLIAYSSIGHVGYILVALAAASEEGVRAIMMYLTIYLSMSIGTFACIMMVRRRDVMSEELSNFSGLAKTNPYIAMAMAIMMLSMAGIPPFAGFFGKFFVFYAAVKSGLMTLAVIGVLSSVVAAFYYLRVIKVMYFDESVAPISKDLEPEMRAIAFVASVYNLFLFVSFPPIVSTAEVAAKSLF
jgi:NADH-quinone oxidoreductase subunit N